VNYIHDFETQTSETFEGSVIGYDAQQFKLRPSPWRRRCKP